MVTTFKYFFSIVNLFFTKNTDSSFDNDLILYESCDFHYYKKDMCDDVYFNKLNKYISLGESDNFYCWLDESYELTSSFTVFEFLKHSEFKYFFSTSLVDIPQCFNHSKSLRRSINKTPLVRFNNYLMRDGKRLKSMNLFLSVLWNIYFNEKNTINTSYITSWRSIYTSLSNVLTTGKHRIYPTNFYLKDFFGYDISIFGKHSHDDFNVNRNLLLNLKKLEPIFLFYVYKVDKNIYKNTRGKSGKYTFIWKYVSSFKRKFLVMHWIMKELKMHSGRTLLDRLNSVLSTLYTNPEKTWVWKIRKFSHNYVYYNCRQTLSETYRTSTK